MTDRKATSIRLSAEADRLLDELAAELKRRMGTGSRSQVLEAAIRELARQWLRDETAKPQDVRQ